VGLQNPGGSTNCISTSWCLSKIAHSPKTGATEALPEKEANGDSRYRQHPQRNHNTTINPLVTHWEKVARLETA
jgi:hypothetical protein